MLALFKMRMISFLIVGSEVRDSIRSKAARRQWRSKYKDGWEAKFRERYEQDMIQKFDTHFYVGKFRVSVEGSALKSPAGKEPVLVVDGYNLEPTN